MKEGSKEWWEAKFQATSDYLYGKAPSEFLVEHIELLRKGETLDVAMGEGRNAVYLSSKGFSVLGVDHSPTAIERAKKLASESGVKLETKVQDLDFFILPLMKYDSIVVCDYHPPLTVLKSLTRGLNKGGTLLLEGYAMEQARKVGPHGEPQAFECYKPNEAIHNARDVHIILYNEREVAPGQHRVQLIARKPLR